MTCRGRDDGGGAQVMACASAMVYARMRGLRYAHTPLREVAHAPAGLAAGEWAGAWESFFSLGLGETGAAELEARGLPVVPVTKPHRWRSRSHCVQVVAHCHNVTDRHPEAWRELAPVLREKYFSTPKPALPDDPPGVIRMGVHLRRGDVTVDGRFAERFTRDEEVLRVIDRLRELLGGERERLVVRVFSQGDPADFAAFVERGAEVHADLDAFATFHQLVGSHVLVLAKSSFSWLAGLLGGGCCVYQPFRHPRLPGWIEAAELDSAAAAPFARAVREAAGSPENRDRRKNFDF